MPELQVGLVTIPWTVRYSPLAKRKRIVATPEGVEIVAPEGTPLEGEGGVEDFVRAKRRWIFDAVREFESRQGDDLVQHYESGAKLLYRGRRLLLDIEPADVNDLAIECRSRFHVRVPRDLAPEIRSAAVRAALVAWMRAKGLGDARSWVARHASRVGVETPEVRLGDQKTMWGSYGLDGVVRVNWRLVQAPAAAMEYVVAHEVCHAIERNHSEAFWSVLGQTLPDWRERKALLERWEKEQSMEAREV